MKINNPWRQAAYRFVFTSGTLIVYIEYDISFISKWSWHSTPAVWTRSHYYISHVRLHSYKNNRRLTYKLTCGSLSMSMSSGPNVPKGCCWGRPDLYTKCRSLIGSYDLEMHWNKLWYHGYCWYFGVLPFLFCYFFLIPNTISIIINNGVKKEIIL